MYSGSVSVEGGVVKTRADLGRPAAAATTGSRRVRRRGRRIYSRDRERL